LLIDATDSLRERSADDRVQRAAVEILPWRASPSDGPGALQERPE
jgi:hypothetical protein